MFNDRGASRALNQLGMSLISAGNQLGSSGGKPAESTVVVLLKTTFWQWHIWRFFRSKMRPERAVFLTPPAVLGVFFIAALILGLLGVDIGRNQLTPVGFYLYATLIFWVGVLSTSIAIWALTAMVRSARRLIWWVRRG